MNNQISLLNGIKWNTVKMIVVTIVQLLSILIIARYISPQEYGLYGMVNIFLVFGMLLADSGFSNAIIYKQENDINKISSLFWVGIVIGFLIFFIMSCASPLISWLYNEKKLIEMIIVASLNLLVLPFGQIGFALARKNLKFKEIALIEIISNSVYIVSMFVLVNINYGVYSLLIGRLISSFVNSFLFLFLLLKNYKITLYWNIQDISDYIKFGSYQIGERTANYFAGNIDYFLIGRFLGAGSLGIYTAAYQLMMLPIQKVNPVVIESFFPFFSKIKNDNSQLNTMYYKLQKILFALIIPLFIGVFLLSDEIINILYTSEWKDASIILKILCVKGIFVTLGNPIGCIILNKGRADLSFKWNVFAGFGMLLFTSIGLNWGIQGVAWSSIIFMIFIAWPADFIIRNIASEAKPVDYFINLKNLILINLVGGIIIWLFREILINSISSTHLDLFVVILTGCLGVVIYMVLYKYSDPMFYNKLKQAIFKR